MPATRAKGRQAQQRQPLDRVLVDPFVVPEGGELEVERHAGGDQRGGGVRRPTISRIPTIASMAPIVNTNGSEVRQAPRPPQRAIWLDRVLLGDNLELKDRSRAPVPIGVDDEPQRRVRPEIGHGRQQLGDTVVEEEQPRRRREGPPSLGRTTGCRRPRNRTITRSRGTEPSLPPPGCGHPQPRRTAPFES